MESIAIFYSHLYPNLFYSIIKYSSPLCFILPHFISYIYHQKIKLWIYRTVMEDLWSSSNRSKDVLKRSVIKRNRLLNAKRIWNTQLSNGVILIRNSLWGKLSQNEEHQCWWKNLHQLHHKIINKDTTILYKLNLTCLNRDKCIFAMTVEVWIFYRFCIVQRS